LKFECLCGNIIVDQTDYLPYKGYLISDQDLFDLMDSVDHAIEKSGPTSLDKEQAIMDIRNLETQLMKIVYQCTQCKRLYINDNHNKLNEFIPIRANNERSILASALGDKWKRPLIGDWNDSRSGELKGYIWCQDYKDRSDYSNFEDLEREYYKQLAFLTENNILRTAMLRYNDQIIHSWE